MKYQVQAATPQEGQRLFDVLCETLRAILQVQVYPYPGVVQDAMGSRNMPVVMDLDETSEEPVFLVQRAKTTHA